MGSIYRKKDSDDQPIGFYYFKYRSPIDGKNHYERTKPPTIDEKAAEAYRIKRLHEMNMGTGRPAGGTVVPTVTDLYNKLKTAYRLGKNKRRGGRTLDNGEFANLELHWSHLAPVFADRDANSIGDADIDRYVERRRSEVTRLGRPPAKASINRELATLRTMYQEGRELVAKLPRITLLDESDNVREGFIEDSKEIKKLFHAAKEPWLRLFVTIALTYAWRVSEIVADRKRPEKGLMVSNVNWERNELGLVLGSTKNRARRIVKMTPEVRKLVRAAAKGQSSKTYLLRRADGSTVYEFRKDWWELCCSVELGQMVCPMCERKFPTAKQRGLRGLDRDERPHEMKDGVEACPVCGYKGRKQYVGLLVHDLRRSAAKRLEQQGFTSNQIKDTGGWKTDSVLRRYQIQSHADREAVYQKLKDAPLG